MPALGCCDSPRNYKIKAGFTYRFILFGEWPDAAFVEDSKTFTIGIVGENPFSDFFGQVANRPVDGRKLVIRYLSFDASQEELRGCQLIFINGSLVKQVSPVLAKVEGFPVLTVSDMEGFIDHGGMIAFFSRRNRIKFAVERTRAAQVGINFRAQMLKMAAQVLEDTDAN